MPALAYSQDIQRRVAQIGFDWENIDGVIDKLVEEVQEFKQTESQPERVDEFGDILFTLVNVARRMGVDPETSLRQANRKFFKRFAYMEKLCRERGLDLGKLSFDEQNLLWKPASRSSRTPAARSRETFHDTPTGRGPPRPALSSREEPRRRSP